MDTNGLKAHCAQYPGAESKLLPAPANVLIYAVGPRQFAYFKTSEPERWRFSVRTTPERFLELTDQPGVRPARYMARFHWVTIVEVGLFDPVYLRELVGWSYAKAVSALPRYQRERLARMARQPVADS